MNAGTIKDRNNGGDTRSKRQKAKHMKTTTAAYTEYDQQAEHFLSSNGIKFRATLSDSKTPAWSDNGKHGHHYRVTLSKPQAPQTGERLCSAPCSTRLTFDFWGSIADAEKGIQTVRPYDVLSCISSDVYTPATFADWCSEYGDSEDSIKALQMFRRCSAFAKRLRAFFTEAELEQLNEIQ